MSGLSHSEFFTRLHESSWKGVLVETGLGLNVSYNMLTREGASKTIIRQESPYGVTPPDGLRAVSLENAKRLAHEGLAEAIGTAAAYEPLHHFFGLAITGAHYTQKASHGWIYFATSQFDSYVHFSLPKGWTREGVSEYVTTLVAWLLELNIFPTMTGLEYVTNRRPRGARIDVLYGNNISDIERLALLEKDNALVYHRGEFHRVVDYLREYGDILSGSFNPVHEGHLARGEGCLFEISRKHCHKGYLSSMDLLHRMRMLDLMDVPVLLTDAPLFLEKSALLLSYETKTFQFVMGSDVWNILVNPVGGYVDPEHLKPLADKNLFKVFRRPDEEIAETRFSRLANRKEGIVVEIVDDEPTPYNSTEIRDDGEFSGVPEKVVQYILHNNQYGLGYTVCDHDR